MGTTVGVGHSFHRNPAEAGKEAALKALEQAGIVKPDMVFVFATVGYNQQILIRAIRDATLSAPLSGCSGEGIITQETVMETNFGVSVMVICSDELRFHNISRKGIGRQSALAGEGIAAEIRNFPDADVMAVLLFADGLFFNFETFESTFRNSFKRDNPLPIYGGLAADNWTSQKTFQYHNDEVFSEGLSCVVLSGSGAIACGTSHGCVPVGTKRVITRSKGNIIYEIDGIPALEALKDYFEEDWKTQWNKTSLNLCLGFRTPEHIKHKYEEYIIRYMMGKDDREGSVTIQSDVSDGTELWLVRRDKELISNGLQMISSQIKEKVGAGKVKFVMQFECMGRGKVVFRELEKIELIRSLQNSMGGNIPWIGFYGYGEIGPVAGYNYFHNFTSVVTAVF